jgi:hypothetical protein
MRDWVEYHRQKARDYYNNVKDTSEAKERMRLYFQKNKQRAYERRRELHKRNPGIRLKQLLGNRIWHALNGRTTKSKRTQELIGCSIDQLREHIESLFKPGMSWDNYGVSGWHIDHIKPCSSFDLTDIEQQKACFNYKNLQPLWARENLTKGCKIL